MGENVKVRGKGIFARLLQKIKKVFLPSGKSISSSPSGVDNQLLSEGSKSPSTELGRRQLDTERQHIRKTGKLERKKSHHHHHHNGEKKQNFEATGVNLDKNSVEISQVAGVKNTDYTELCSEVYSMMRDWEVAQGNGVTIRGDVWNVAPKFVEICEAGKFTKEFIENFCSKLSELKNAQTDLQRREYYERMETIFQRLVDPKTPEVWENFNSNVQDYVEQIRNTHSQNEKQAIRDRLQLFIHNAIVPPYQRDDEGSCFATSILMNIWNNHPIKYMQLIRGVVDDDEVNFGILQKKPNRNDHYQADVSSYNIGIADEDKVYQCLISAFAFQDTKASAKEAKFFKKKLNDKKFLRQHGVNINFRTRRKVSKKVEPLAIWRRGRWLPKMQISNEDTITKQDAIDKIKENPVEEYPRLKKDEKSLNNLSESIFEDLEEGGGRADIILDNVFGMDSYVENKVKFERPVREGKFSIEQFQPILKILGKRKPGKFLLASYELEKRSKHFSFKTGQYEDIGDGHMFNFKAGKYNIKDMRLGDKICIGHLNYEDGFDSSGLIFLKKLDDNTVQLIRLVDGDEEPIITEEDGAITRFFIYSEKKDESNHSLSEEKNE